MASIGIHAIDLVLSTIGRRVVAASGRQWLGRANVDVATRGELTISLEGGARADVTLTVDAEGANTVRLAVRGAGSAHLVAGEADPTGSPLTLRGVAPCLLAGAGGALGSPLLVPFVHEALAAFDARLPTLSVDDVADGHALALAFEAE